MLTKKHFYILGLPLVFLTHVLFSQPVRSQSSLYSGFMELSTGYIPSDNMPFWLRSNQFGNIPLHNASVGYLGAFSKTYDKNKKSAFDWGAALETKVNLGQESNVILLEGYAKMRLYMFELQAGRSKDFMGMSDSTLSVGAFSMSGNSVGIPKVEISIPEFYTLPFLWNLFAFKGSLIHGWVGKTPVKWNREIIPTVTYLHQKSLYGRFGKEHWKLHLLGGVNHQVFWGNETTFYGDSYELSTLETYYHIMFGIGYGNKNIPRSKIGNHHGSIDMGLEYDFPGFRLFAYRQNIFDIGALWYLANIHDGLNGISLTNTSKRTSGLRWEKMVFEFFYTKNQAGELWSTPTPSGDENYYNNYQYTEGWSYNGVGLGNPFIGTRDYIQKEHPTDPTDYFINNRVVVFHSGIRASLNSQWDFTLKASYSFNYGTYGTSEPGHSVGRRYRPPQYGLFGEARQFSSYLEVNRALNNKLYVGVSTGFDVGELYYDSAGFIARIARVF
jgi:hypothetical protein